HEQSLPVTIDRYGSSGETQERLDYYSMGIKADYDNFTFKGRFLSRESGASYGQSFSLSEDETDYTAVDSNNAEMSYATDIVDDVKVNVALGYIELNRRLQNKVVPDGGTVGPPPTILPNGRYFLTDLIEKTSYQQAELNIKAIDMHHINLGVYATQTDMVKREGQLSNDGMQTFTTINLLKDTPRDLVSIYIDDLIDLTEKISVQLGVKYDHYSDIDNQHSPRVAMVHRYDDENIFKYMYTSSYREPAWREQYLTQASFFKSTIDIRPEQVDAYEVAYINKIGQEGHLEVNAFYLKNKDQIHAQNLTNTFINSGDNNLYGAEIEYKYVFQDNDQLYFNYSHVVGENVGEKLAGSASYMSKFYYIYRVSDALSMSAMAKYVSSKDRIKEDAREKVDCYSIFDFSINYNVKQADLDINLSIKNVADKRYYLSSPTYPASPASLNATYPDDFEREGRSFLVSVRKGF
ncbi:MAG: TonB-dependent receptor, partial [Gammaproteobacteria bacterium]|nr:TonB-dependent receptor [Gammaproteobacteria bacterium]